MTKVYTPFVFVIILALVIFSEKSYAQTTVSSPVPTSLFYWSDANQGVIVFGVQNTNTYDIVVTEIANHLENTWGGEYSLWYNPTTVTGAPGVIETANGWIKASPSGMVAPTADGVATVINGLNIIIPANTTYRFALEAPVHAPLYGASGSQADIASAGGVNLLLQSNPLSPNYAGNFPGPPTSTPRGFYGSITFDQYTTCVAPVAGAAAAYPAIVCAGSATQLYLTGSHIAIGQTYVWESSASASGPWTTVGSSSASPYLTVNPTTNTFYRAAVSCNAGVPQHSTPVEVQVSPALAANTYSLDPSLPTGGLNFQTFTDAITAMQCGISGPVVFAVAPGAIFTQQIVIPQIPGASSSNTIRFLGNGATIQVAPTAAERSAILLDGADYVTIDSFNITTTDATYGWGVHFMNGADHDSIRACNINVSAVTSTGTSNSAGIVMSNSTTVATTDGNFNYNVITNSIINGGYRGIIINGTSGALNAVGNKINRNVIHDFYSSGVETTETDSLMVSYNDIHRMNRTGVTTFAGVELGAGNKNAVINGNRIHDTHNAATTQSGTAYGIYSTANDAPTGEENIVTNNLVYNFNSTTGTQYGIYNTGSNNVKYYHNTVVLDNQTATSGTTRGFYQTTAATGIEVRNNIFYVTRSGSGTRHGVYFGNTTSEIISNNNVFYVVASATTVGVGSFGTANAATLADWQAANGAAYDQQSVSEDPMFTGGGDFTPMNSTINGMGGNVGITTDILGVARTVSSPDPGAYEFTVVGLDADISWISPVMPVTAGSQAITVKITNTQTATINSINLSYTDGTAVQTQTFTGLNIAAGGTTQLSFTTQYNFTESVQLRAYINLVNGMPDNNQVNDTTAVQNLCLPLSGDYTINPNIPVASRNFHTLTDAVNLLACSGVSGQVRFTVEPGSFFTEQVTIPQITGASEINTIRFLGNGAYLQAAPTTSDRHIIRLDGADYVTIDSFNISSTATDYGWGIHFTNGADHDSIRACFIDVSSVTSTTQSNSGGIVMSGSTTSVTTDGSASHNVIVRNIIKGGYQGIIINGATGALNAVGNKITQNTIHDFYSNGIEITENDSVIISRNNIHRSGRSAVTTFIGVELGTGNKNSTVDGNRIHDTHTSASSQTGTAYGIYSTGDDAPVGEENRIINNLVYNFNSGSGTQYGIYSTGSDGVFYYHNTVVLDYGGSTAGTTRGFYQTTAATNVDLRNNIFYITRGGTGTKHALYFNTAGSEITSNKNVLYVMASGTTGIGSLGSANAATLVDWQAVDNGGTTYDQESISVDPMFVSPGFDFTPTDPTVNNMGDAVGVTMDITGRVRSLASPDPGAYEYSLLTVGNNLVAEALITPAQTSNDCFTTTETVTLRIRNNSTSDIDFALNPVTATVNITGAGTQTLTEVLNSGILKSDSTRDVVFTTPANMVTVGTYTFNGNVDFNGGGDIDPSNNAIAPVDRIRAALATGVVAITPEEYCVSSTTSPVLSSDNATGYSGLQWQQSTTSGSGFTDITGATTIPYTVTTPITQTMYYRLVATCGTATITSLEDTLEFGDPMITGTTPASRCGSGTVDLTATANVGIVKWYEAATGGLEIASGNNFTTPPINSTTTYYAAASFGGMTYTADHGLPTVTTTTQNTGLLFNLNRDVVLNSVDVYTTTGSGDVVIALYDNSNTLIYTSPTFTVTTGSLTTPQTLQLNWTIPAGTGYRILVPSHTPSLGYHTGSFPIILGNGAGEVVSGATATGTSTLNYFIYNMQTTVGCESPRTAVTATVTPAPTFAISADTTICNDAAQALSVTTGATDFNSFEWSPQADLYTDAAATIPYTGGSAAQLYVKTSTAGTYRYFATATNTTTLCGGVDSVDVTVMPVPTITSSAPGICFSGTTTLSVDPATGYGNGSLQWQTSADGISYTDISGATNVSYTTPTLTQSTYYKLILKNEAGATCSEPTFTMNVNTPSITSTTPGSRCGNGTVALTATGSAGTTVNWYENASGGAPIFTGDNFTTPVLSNTTTYYATASTPGGAVYTGGVTSAPQRNYINSTVGWGNHFTVHTPCTLTSVDVYPEGTGTVTIHILDPANNILYSSPVANVTGTGYTGAPATVPVNIALSPGDYKLGFSHTGITSAGAHNIGTIGYPFVTPALTVTAGSQGTSTSATVHYWFYNWKITVGCESPTRTAVIATINQPTGLAGVASGTECVTSTMSAMTEFNFTDCQPIAKIAQAGASPMTGSVDACVTIDATVQTAPDGIYYVQRHYDVTPATNAATATSTITLYFLQSDFDAHNTANGPFLDLPANSTDATGIANLRITQYNGTGTAPGNYTGSTVLIDPTDGNIVWNSTESRWEITFAATGSGGFYVHTGNFVLPVTQLNFRGEQSGSINKLLWSTATETNNKGFELERSADGRNFSSVTFVASKAENGNSTSTLNYSYNDARPNAGSNYYRLKQVDKDGKFSYSNVILLSRKVTEITLSSVYPNPTERELNLVITSPKSEKVMIVVTDLTGKVVMQHSTQLVMGDNQESLNVQSLSAGTYIIKAVCGNGCETAVHRFVKL